MCKEESFFSFNKYLLSAYYVPGTVNEAMGIDTAVRTDKVPALEELPF